MAVTPGTTNVLQVNPNQSNQDTDSQYAGEGIVTGGAQQDGLLPSKFFNKFCYQVTTVLAAFATALTQKGYTIQDGSLSVLTATMSNVLTEADILPPLVPLSYAPTMTFDGSVANGWQVTLYGNVTSLSIVNLKQLHEYTVMLVQDNVGSRTVAYPSSLGTSLSSAPQPDPTAGAASIFKFIVNTDSTLRFSSAQIVS